MLGAKQTGTNTITQERKLPPYIEQMMRGAGGQLDYFAQNWRPSSSTLAGVTDLAQWGLTPNANLGAANQYHQDVLGGNYLYGGEGFNAALDAATRRILPGIEAGFTGAGRNPRGEGLASVARTQALADAFASLYGQERGLQQRTLEGTPNLMQAQQMQPLATLQAGNIEENLYRDNAERYARNTANLARSAGGADVQSEPIYENELANLLGLGAGGIGLLEGIFGEGSVGDFIGGLFGADAGKGGAGGALGAAGAAAGSAAAKSLGTRGGEWLKNLLGFGGGDVALGIGAGAPAGSVIAPGALVGGQDIWLGPAAAAGQNAPLPAMTGKAAGETLGGVTDFLSDPLGGITDFLSDPLGGIGNLFEGGAGFVVPAFIAGSLAGLTHVITDDKGAEQQRAWTQLYNNVTGAAPVTIPAGMPGAGQQGIPVQTPQGLVFADPNNYIGGQMYRVVGDPNNVIAATRDGQIAYGPISQTKWFQDQAMAQAQAPLELLNLDPTDVRSVAAQLGVNIPIQTWNDALGPQPIIPERLGETTDTFVSGGSMLIDRPINVGGRTTTLREMWQERQRQGGDAGGDGGN